MSPHDYVNIWHDMQQCCIKQIHSQNMERVRVLRSLLQAWASAASRRVLRHGQPEAQSHQSVHAEQTELEPALEPEERASISSSEERASISSSDERASICKVEQWMHAGGGKAPELCSVLQLGQKPSQATKERRARTARERAATPPVFEQSAAEEKKRKRDNNTDEAIALYKTKTAP